MPAPKVTEARAEQWMGRISNADPHDLPAGAMVVQDNIQCLKAGELTVRRGIVKNADYTPSSPAAYTVISLYGFTVPDTDWMIGMDSNGTAKARRSSGSTVSIATGKSAFYPWSVEKARNGPAILLNGMDRGIIWNGLSAGSGWELGIDPPSAAPTIATPVGGASAAGDYTCAYRYVDSMVPTERYSSISSSTTATAVASDQFEWTSLSASSQTRVILVELWRSAVGAGNTLYRIARLGHDGTVSTITDNGSTKCRITCTASHNLAVGAVLTVAGSDVGGYNASHEVTAVISATVVDTDVAYSSDGTGGTWQLTGFKNDTSTDATLIAAAVADTTLQLQVLSSATGQPLARKHNVPPKWKAVVKHFQDRYWYAVDVIYGTGTITTDGTTSVVGSGTAWTTDMDGRYIYIDGEAEPLLISSVGSATAITLSEAATTSSAGLTYAIRASGVERNRLWYSEPDLPESVTANSYITLQENTDDDDDITGLMPFGSVLYVLKDRHIYSLTFARQPNLDATPKLIAARGAFNHRCYDIHEGISYLMDEMGCYRMSPSGDVEPISGPVQDLFRGSSIDFTYRKWFHVCVDSRYELVYFFVTLSGDTYPEDAIVYNIRSGQIWTESYFCGIADSTKGLQSVAVVPYLAGENDVVFQLNGAETDYVASQTRGTATGGSTTTIEDSSAPFTAAMVGAPVVIDSGTNKFERRVVISRTTTALTVDSAFTAAIDTTSTYRVGGIPWSFKTGRMDLPEADSDNERSVEVVFEPTSGQNYLDIRRYYNHETTPENNAMDQAVNVGGLVTRTASDPNDVADLKLARVSASNHPGWLKAYFTARLSGPMQGVRYIQIESRGVKGDDVIKLYDMTVSGAK